MNRPQRNAPLREDRGFTFVEALAAMLFMAIVIPVMVQGIAVANRAGVLAERKREATHLADRRLTELVVTGDWRNREREGDFGDDWPGFTWSMTDEPWELDTMRVITVTVSYQTQGREYRVELSALAEEETDE